MNEGLGPPHQRSGSDPIVPSAVPDEVVAGLRGLSKQIAGIILRGIEAEVTVYASRPGRRRHQLMKAAIDAAVAHFLELAAGKRARRPDLAELFGRLGRGEAEDRHHLDRMLAAWQVATRQAWREISRYCTEVEAGTRTLSELGDLLHTLMDELFLHVEAGFFAAKRPHDVRARLGRALLLAPDSPAVPQLAAAADWPMPRQVMVAVVERSARTAELDLVRFGRGLLTWDDTNRTTVIVDAAAYDGMRDRLLAAVHPAPIALMGPVRLRSAPDAHRWARRALHLRRTGQLPSAPVIDCTEWTELLLLAADPALRDFLVASSLAPLAVLQPHNRHALAWTLQLWLTSTSGAQHIAKELGVHEQTVRYRQRRLRDLFGDRLGDPKERMRLLMALGAALPEWQDAARRRRR
ncbi:MAG TPA: helix-turn-helix domain-containing protein [Nocardioides sp.]|uniref:PucR family transcriptional regulator n=1 Tax=Nocardioides sp. TaxID=35761 RepID=UPI002EDA588F